MLCLIIVGDLSSECNWNCNSLATPVIAGVIIAIIGIMVGVPRLITAFVMLR